MKKQPRYIEISEDIKAKIENNTYKNTGMLPTEIDLCEQYDVSKITIKRAVDLLVAKGLVTKKQGSGTYVNQLFPSEDLLSTETSSLSGFTRTNPNVKTTVDVKTFEIIRADKKLAQNLNISEGDFVYEMFRVRSEHDIPFVTEHTFITVDLIPGLKESDVKSSVYSYITNTLNKRIDTSHEYIYADYSNQTDQDFLKIGKEDPITVLEQVVFLDNGVQFQYSVTRYKQGRFRYKGVTKIDI